MTEKKITCDKCGCFESYKDNPVLINKTNLVVNDNSKDYELCLDCTNQLEEYIDSFLEPPELEKKDQLIQLRCTKTQLKKVEKEANLKSLTTSEYIRIKMIG